MLGTGLLGLQPRPRMYRVWRVLTQKCVLDERSEYDPICPVREEKMGTVDADRDKGGSMTPIYPAHFTEKRPRDWLVSALVVVLECVVMFLLGYLSRPVIQSWIGG